MENIPQVYNEPKKEKTAEEITELKEAFINEHLTAAAEANPDITPQEVEVVRKSLSRTYDMLRSDPNRQVNELYAEKWEKLAKHWQTEMVVYENQLNGAKDEVEKKSIMEKLIEARDLAMHFSSEAKARRAEIASNQAGKSEYFQ